MQRKDKTENEALAAFRLYKKMTNAKNDQVRQLLSLQEARSLNTVRRSGHSAASPHSCSNATPTTGSPRV